MLHPVGGEHGLVSGAPSWYTGPDRRGMKRNKQSAAILDMEPEGGLKEEVTARAGVALLLAVSLRSGVTAAADPALPAKQNSKGLTHGQVVETIVLLSAPGGAASTICRRFGWTGGWRRWRGTGCRLPRRRSGHARCRARNLLLAPACGPQYRPSTRRRSWDWASAETPAVAATSAVISLWTTPMY